MKAAVVAAARWAATFKHLSLLAVIPITAHAHWHLAVQLGIPYWLAPLLPVAVDSYVLASFRAWREQANQGQRKVKTWDLAWALGLDAVAVAGSHAASHFDLTTTATTGIRATLAAALGILLVLTLWRVHALDVKASPQVRAGSQPRRVQAHTDPVLAPAVTPEPAATPAAPAPTSEVTQGSSLTDVTGPVTLERWVARQFRASAQRAEVIRVGAERFGVSESTVKRRWTNEQRTALARPAVGE